MATAWGWLLAGLLLPALALVVSGIFAGALQWLVLQGRIVRPWRWVIASSLGWIAGYFLTLFLLPQELAGLTIGLTTGIAQWLLLRRQLHWAGWWIVFSAIGWITGLTLLPGLFSTGTMAGALTGLCLEVLLRYPKPKMMATNSSA